MSIWASVKGTISIRKDNHISLDKLIKESFDEVCISLIDKQNHNNLWLYKIEFSFCGDGVSAVELFEKFINELKHQRRGTVDTQMDLELTTRWVH